MGSGSSKKMAPVATRTIETQTDVSNLEDVPSQSDPGTMYFQARATHGPGTRAPPPTATVLPVTANGQHKTAGHGGNQEGVLPSPKPPSTSKDQLMENQNYQEMDERARQATASEANSFDGLNQYLMKGKKETVAVESTPGSSQNHVGDGEAADTDKEGAQHGAVRPETSRDQSQANGETGELEEARNTAGTNTTQQEAAGTLQEDVERQIEEAKATQAKIDMQRQMSKKRQQLTLQEKLEARKRKRQEDVNRQEEKRAREELAEKHGIAMPEQVLGQQTQVTDVKGMAKSNTEGKTVRFADDTALNLDEKHEEVVIPSEEPVPKGIDRHEEIKKAEEAAPLMPKMPVTKKASVYKKEDISLFKDLEDHAVSLALVKPKTTDTFATLMEVLLIHDLSDLEKVRMIFHWVTAQNLNEMSFGDDVEDDSPAGYLKAIKEERQTYATLFERLCSAAGLHSKTVHGYMKGVRYNPDHHFDGPGDRHRGTWNAVLVDGEWRLIDCHWGSRHVTEGRYLIEIYGGEDTGDQEHTETSNVCLYMIVCESAKQSCTPLPECPIAWGPGRDVVKAGMTPLTHKEAVIKADTGQVEIKFRRPSNLDFRQNLYKVKCEETELAGFAVNVLKSDEVTFLVRAPEKGTNGLIIYGKNGDESKFSQLCYYVIECEKDPDGVVPFPQAANHQFGPLEPQFSELGLVQTENANYHLKTENGEVNVNVRLTNEKLLAFKHILSSRAQDGKESLDQYVLRQTVDNTTSMLFRPPHAGEYSLALYAGTGTELKNVVNFFITCDKPKDNVQPFPVIGDASWGPILPPFSDIGLSLVAPKTAYITSDTGEVTIDLGLSKPVMLRTRMSLHKDGTKCTKLLTDATPFPKIVGAKWGPGCRLHEPTSGVLSRDQVVNFKVDVPHAFQVAVKGDSVQAMNKIEGNTWEAKYAVGKAEKTVAILANYEEGSQKFAGLLGFTVAD
uniref:KY-like immunoglobulin-like domain-containing protein n=1 Tax=Branchiostoma floridae TaxID=7739 RepID=C3Y510_BRAFL|eukprot:XP_002608533.1 hypothetical protein BRAFLDRAFT_92385 [Branchiostoma floridae]